MEPSLYEPKEPEPIEKTDKVNRFRDAEKIYRAPPEPEKVGKKERKKLPKKEDDFSHVIDFTNLDHNTPENRKKIVEVDIKERFESKYHQKIEKAYTLTDHEGLYFIPNPFTPEQQKYWTKRCLLDFTVGNPTNVSNLNKTPPWTKWDPSYKLPLRWATLGYHYQWTPRKYLDEFKGEFPEDVRELLQSIAYHLGYNKYLPEAATLNYYPHSRQSMCGHLDNAEDDMTQPIVSCSFGNTVIFLMGGRTVEEEPTPFFIRSGDIVVMGGNSRYCYHGVPRMIANSLPEFLQNNEKNWPSEWKECGEYIIDARININGRQVRKHS